MASVALPLHKANKRVVYQENDGMRHEKNLIKLETFIFDALPYAAHTGLYIYPREKILLH